MIRTLFGGLLGGLALFLTGFVFWGTPLSNLAFTGADPQASANLQAAMAQALTTTGTGVYIIPSPATSEGTILYGKGPIAQIFFNTGGFPVVDGTSMISGLILALVVGIVLALALRVVAGDAAARIRVAVAFSAAAVLWLHIGQPVFNHAPWGYFLYLAFSDFVGLVLAGVIAAKLIPTVLEDRQEAAIDSDAPINPYSTSPAPGSDPLP